MSDVSPSPPRSLTSAALALCGFWLVPVLVVVDSIVAMAQGWSPRFAGAFGLLAIVAAGVFVASLALALFLGRFRRLVARQLVGCWVFGVASLVALVIAELALAYLWPAPAFHLRQPNTRYVFEPNLFQLPGTSVTAQTSYNAQGIRGPDWPSRERSFRILCLGDSATECIYIDDADTWTARLAKELPEMEGKPTWVGAAAVSEVAVAQHTSFLRHSPLVDQVDVIVAMVGVNDFLRSLMQLDVWATPAPQWLESRWIELARYDWNGRLKNGYYYDLDGRTLRFRRLGREIRPFAFDRRKAAQEFGVRLREMIAAAKARNVRLVLVTQPVLWDDFLSDEAFKRLWLARTDPLPREWQLVDVSNSRDSIDEFNDVMLAVAEEAGAELADLGPRLTGWDANFYDDYHLSRRGCELLAQGLAAYLREHPPQQAAQAAPSPGATP